MRKGDRQRKRGQREVGSESSKRPWAACDSSVPEMQLPWLSLPPQEVSRLH